MTKKIDETYNVYKRLEELEKEGLLMSTDSAIVGLLADMSFSLARITDALEKLKEVE